MADLPEQQKFTTKEKPLYKFAQKLNRFSKWARHYSFIRQEKKDSYAYF